jgi:predicted DNA-binding transcriptional regulator YafY
MIPNILQILTTAIKERRALAMRYHDQRDLRVIEPHALYYNERGEIVLDAFQTRGYSASGRPPPYWRPFRIKRISAITVLREQFAPRVAEGFSASKLKYRSGLLALVEDRRPTSPHGRTITRVAPEEMGPHLPAGNPHRR